MIGPRRGATAIALLVVAGVLSLSAPRPRLHAVAYSPMGALDDR